jgi:hypothetical protein
MSRLSPNESLTPPACQHKLPALCPAKTTPVCQQSHRISGTVHVALRETEPEDKAWADP